MPRHFTTFELSIFDYADLERMGAEDRKTFYTQQAFAFDPKLQPDRYLDGDYDWIGSRKRFEYGE